MIPPALVYVRRRHGYWLPVFLLWRRTRPLAVLASLGLIAAIQLGAHELVFGAMFSSLVLLFARRDWLTPLLPVFAMGALVMLALRFWLAPDWRFG